MGLLDFNITEIASRMVRGGSVRGRIRPTLDDGILPAILVNDWTRAPYRLDEQKYFQGIFTPSFNAADGHAIGILNNSAKSIVLEWWRVVNRTGTAGRVQVTMELKASFDALIAQQNAAFTGYEGGFNANNPGQVRNDIVMRSGRVAGAIFPQVGNIIDSFDLPTNATPPSWCISAPALDLVIPPGAGIIFSVPVVGISCALSAQIRVINNTQNL